jgi:hypothetical protein
VVLVTTPAVPVPVRPLVDHPLADHPLAGRPARSEARVAVPPPFRRTESPAEADRLLGSGLVRPLVADVLVAFDAPESRDLRVAAADLLIPQRARDENGWVVGFDSAAWLHTGLWAHTPAAPGELQVIVAPKRRRPVAPGVRGRQLALDPGQVMFLGRVPVTVPARTAADVARDLPTELALPILRRLGQLTDVRAHHVLHLLGTMRYARGAATARRTVKVWAEQD